MGFLLSFPYNLGSIKRGILRQIKNCNKVETIGQFLNDTFSVTSFIHLLCYGLIKIFFMIIAITNSPFLLSLSDHCSRNNVAPNWQTTLSGINLYFNLFKLFISCPVSSPTPSLDLALSNVSSRKNSSL